jgi:hypothetical protein
MEEELKLICGMPEESGPSFRLTVSKFVPGKELVVDEDVCTFDGKEERLGLDVERWKDPRGESFIVYGRALLKLRRVV